MASKDPIAKFPQNYGWNFECNTNLRLKQPSVIISRVPKDARPFGFSQLAMHVDTYKKLILYVL